MQRRVAVVDCGTNTVRLLIADRDGAELREVARDLRFTRLGQGVDATGRFHPEALARTFAAVEDYASIIASSRVDKVRFVATSAARDVANREEFFAGVRDRLGIDPDVIDGDEEAQLSFLGALSGGPTPPTSPIETIQCGVRSDDGAEVRTEPLSASSTVLVMDIGGGSTELIRGTVQGQVEAKASLNMGSVRLRERFLVHDPPLPDEVAAARQFVGDMLHGGGVGLGGVGTWIGVAGTVTSLSAMNQDMTTYDREKVHNSTISQADLSAIAQRLLTLSVAETMATYPSLQPMRAEVIAAGALIAAEIAARVNGDLLDAPQSVLPPLRSGPVLCGDPEKTRLRIPEDGNQVLLVRETDILDGAALKLMRS